MVESAQPATFVKPLDQKTDFVVGDDIVLKVTTQGNPPPSVTFFKGDVEVFVYYDMTYFWLQSSARTTNVAQDRRNLYHGRS